MVVRRRPPQLVRIKTGPWKGTRTTTDPLDFDPSLLIDATNVYVADPENASGVYARPGLALGNDGSPLTTSATTFRGQGAWSHTALDGTTTNFCVFNGKLFRSDSQLIAWTDVSPVGITIDSSVTTRVYGTSLADQLVVTDGVNKPWLASNLSSTPITGTYIQYNAGNDAWCTYGPFRIYGGSGFCILNTVAGTSRRTDISWSAPGDLATGYEQANYDYNWTLEQQSANPLYALWGTNTNLIYWRSRSIGSLAGPVTDLIAQATHDAISTNVGTEAPQSIVAFGTTLYFTDQIGRPYRLVPGAEPEPIWLQMRGIVDANTTGFPGVTKTTTTAAYEPTLNQYIVAVWSTIPSQVGPPVEGYVFDAHTGQYFGRYEVTPGCQIETLATLTDGEGRGTLIVLGSIAAPTSSTLATSGYVWSQNSLYGVGDYLTTEDSPGLFLTLEDDTTDLTSEGLGEALWQDNGQVPTIEIVTDRLGYDLDKVITVDRVQALVGTTAPVTVSALTAAVAETVEGIPTPSTVQDGISKLVIGLSGIQGRGCEITLSPTTADEQWSAQQVEVVGVLNDAAPDEV